MRLLRKKSKSSAASIWRNKPTNKNFRNSPISHEKYGLGLSTNGTTATTNRIIGKTNSTGGASSLSRERLVNPHLGRRTPVSFMSNNSHNGNYHDPNVIDHYVHHGHITQAVRLFDRDGGRGNGYNDDYDSSDDDNTRIRHNRSRHRRKNQTSHHRYGRHDSRDDDHDDRSHRHRSKKGMFDQSNNRNQKRHTNLFSDSGTNGTVKLFDRRGDSNSIGSTGGEMRNVLISDSRDDDHDSEYNADIDSPSNCGSSVPPRPYPSPRISTSNSSSKNRQLISPSPPIGESPSSISFMMGLDKSKQHKSNRKTPNERIGQKAARDTIQEEREDNDMLQLKQSYSLNHRQQQQQETRQFIDGRSHKNCDKGKTSSVSSAPAILMIPPSKQGRAAMRIGRQLQIDKKKQTLSTSKPPRHEWYASQQVPPSLSTTSSVSRNKGLNLSQSATNTTEDGQAQGKRRAQMKKIIHESSPTKGSPRLFDQNRDGQQEQEQRNANESFSVSSEIQQITGGGDKGSKSFLQRRMMKTLVRQAKTSKSPIPTQSGRHSASVKETKKSSASVEKRRGSRSSPPSSSSSSVSSHQQTKNSNERSDIVSSSASSQQRKQPQQPYELAHCSSTAAVVVNSNKSSQGASHSSSGGNDTDKEGSQNFLSYPSNLFGGLNAITALGGKSGTDPSTKSDTPGDGNISKGSSRREKIKDKYIPQEIEWNKVVGENDDGDTIMSLASSLSSATAGRKELVEQIRQMMIIPLSS